MRWQRSIRTRLAASYSLIVGILLFSLAGASIIVMERGLVRQTDSFLRDAESAFRAELRAEEAELPSASEALAAALDEFRVRNLTVMVFEEGSLRPLGSTPAEAAPGPEFPAGAEPAQVRDALRAHEPVEERLFTVGRSEGGFRVLARRGSAGGRPAIIAVAQSLHSQQEAIEDVLAAFSIAVGALLIIAAVTGYLLARRSLAPVAAMGRRAAEITATSLNERLPVLNPHDELGELAGVINGLLDRLENSFAQYRHFMADASHELRTPVAILRNEAEIALMKEERSAAEYRHVLTTMLRESVRLSRIVNDLFLLARADAGHHPLRREDLYLNELAEDVVRSLESVANEYGIRVSLASEGDAPYCGDANLLRGLLTNLVENAIKYTRPGGTVVVSVSLHDSFYEVSVNDDGPGIPPASQAKVFERFYRAGGVHVRADRPEADGAGLGLPIARWVAEMHGGKLELVRSGASGTEFRLKLPRDADLPGIGELPA